MWSVYSLNAVISAASKLIQATTSDTCAQAPLKQVGGGVKTDSSRWVAFFIGSYGGQGESIGFETCMY